MYIEKIKSLNDFKKLDKSDLIPLSNEIRDALINKTSLVGGHVGPNLGDIELTIALHYVFNSPIDKIIFDVSHQTYTHKILTGRGYAFINKNDYHDVTGFYNTKESEHDLFNLGHTSTSISLGLGMAKGRNLNNEKYNVISIIGDGSLGGGEALEALDNIKEIGGNFILIVNDNDMSISENHGEIYDNLKKLRETGGEYQFNLFKILGLDYAYLDNGNDIYSLIHFLNKYKDISHPIVLHIKTIKGEGYKFAELEKERFHYSLPYDIKTGELKSKEDLSKDLSEITFDFLSHKMDLDNKVVAITAATPSVIAFNSERRKKYSKQFIDVGICEQHAIGLLSGLAKAKAKAYFAIYASFMQRGYDQISQDFSLNNNPGTILVFENSIFSMTSMTHLGIFDIAVLSNIPNLIYLDPTNIDEYLDMLEFSYNNKKYPLAIRVPVNFIKDDNYKKIDFNKINKNLIYSKGKDIAIFAVGNLFELAKEISMDLIKKNINITLVKPIYLNEVDYETLDLLLLDHNLFITLEDSILDGGYGQKISSYLGKKPAKVYNFGIKKKFYDSFNPKQVLEECGISKENIINLILKELNGN